jgi:hypothetical protein
LFKECVADSYLIINILGHSVFWDVMLGGVVNSYHNFRGAKLSPPSESALLDAENVGTMLL